MSIARITLSTKREACTGSMLYTRGPATVGLLLTTCQTKPKRRPPEHHWQ